ncbi:MAG: hypothetical protein H0X16_08565 [Chloroflexi bacterium]|nr:hypothetical protein [Chloroflexota bacterium]
MPVPEDLPSRVRKFVFDHFLEHAAPPVVERLMSEFSLSREEATDEPVEGDEHRARNHVVQCGIRKRGNGNEWTAC